jgi:hypothetical protein
LGGVSKDEGTISFTGYQDEAFLMGASRFAHPTNWSYWSVGLSELTARRPLGILAVKTSA